MPQRVTQINFENFLAFKKLKTEFSPYINVIVGANGTGKTLLLKSIFHHIKSATLFNSEVELASESHQRKIADNLIETIAPRCSIQDLKYRNSFEDAFVEVLLEGGNKLRTSISQSKDIQTEISSPLDSDEVAIFIPSGEFHHFLPFVNGSSIVERMYPDQTYREISKFLLPSNLNFKRLHEPVRTMCSSVEDILGGKFYIAHDGSLVFSENYARNNRNDLSVQITADGLCKLGILSLIVQSDQLKFDRSGPILWDLPESNLNPSNIRTIVEILLELARCGMQIIVSTHSYVCMKWFDLLNASSERDMVYFHNLYRETQTSEILINTTVNFGEILDNSISEAYSSLTNFQLSKFAEKYVNE